MPRGPSSSPSIRRVIRGLASAWKTPRLPGLAITLNSRMSRPLGRVVLQPLGIQLSPAALSSPHKLEVIAHEAAHAALALAGKARTTRPHGPEWRRLMALAGFPKAKATRASTCLPRRPARKVGTPYVHRCPVCQTTRTAKRPVQQWRCAACTAAGLTGRLVIHKAAARA